jgi:hypothetical protein
MSQGFLGAGDSRQLIIQAERKREKQLASLFYKTAGGRPTINTASAHKATGRNKKKKRRSIGASASIAGGQPFSGVRRKQRNTTARRHSKNSRSMMVSKSRRPRHSNEGMSQSLPVLANNNDGGSRTSALDDFADAAMASNIDGMMHDNTSILDMDSTHKAHVSTTGTFNNIRQEHTGIVSERAWEAHQVNDAALHRFTELGGAESLQRPPAPVGNRTSVVEGYKTYNDYDQEYILQQEQQEQQQALQQQEEEYSTLMGGHVQTLGGMNLPLTAASGGPLPILSLGAVSGSSVQKGQSNYEHSHYNDSTTIERSPVSKLYKDLNIQQDLAGIPSSAVYPRPKSRGATSGVVSPTSMKRKVAPPLVDNMSVSSPGFIEHHMHYAEHGGRRVNPERYSTVGDRVAGILLLRTEQLEKEIENNHHSETKIMNNIQSNIEYSRTSLLPLDFIFRKALRRYRISFLKVAMSKWFSFILRSRTIEKLLNKVVPYCISIQKIWRGVLGRKRKCIEQDVYC